MVYVETTIMLPLLARPCVNLLTLDLSVGEVTPCRLTFVETTDGFLDLVVKTSRALEVTEPCLETEHRLEPLVVDGFRPEMFLGTLFVSGGFVGCSP